MADEWTRKQVLSDPIGAIVANIPRVIAAVEALGTPDEIHDEDPGLVIAAGYVTGALLEAQKKIEALKERQDNG